MIVARPVVSGIAELVLNTPSRRGDICEWQSHMTLALVRGVVYGDQQTLAIGALPGKHDETIVSPIAVPGRHTFEQLPLAAAHNWIPNQGQQATIELLKLCIDRLVGTAAEVRRDPFAAAFELTLMEKPQSGREECDHRRRAMHVGTERGGRSRLVVVFKETSQLVLVIESGPKVISYRWGMLLAQAIVQPLVVRIVESLLLHGPFQVPVHLGHESEARYALAHALDRARPRSNRGGLRPTGDRAPCGWGRSRA
jgi:hypothetical protein